MVAMELPAGRLRLLQQFNAAIVVRRRTLATALTDKTLAFAVQLAKIQENIH